MTEPSKIHYPRQARTLASLFGGCILLLASNGCGAGGSYVWVADLPPLAGASADYAIMPGDLLSVRVYNQDAMSTKARVRSDGKISVPLAGDVEVAGKPPVTVAHELEARLKAFVVTPAVTVMVEEFSPPSVVVVGEVVHPGVYNLDTSASVLRALALAGGVSEYASRDNIYVLRAVAPRRVRFTYRDLTENEPRATSYRLRAGDTVVVE
jgi:polysaccharide export outer membrane protein